MARKRMIDPDYWLHEQFGTGSLLAQLLFIGMWNFADDEGLIRYSAAYLRSAIFPYRDIALEEIEDAKREIEAADSVFPYKDKDKTEYCYVINFLKHQTINKPQRSKIPPPSIQNKAFQRVIFERDEFTCYLCGGPVAYTDHPQVGNHASIDHVVPKSKGGNNYPKNLKCACISCNKSRGATTDKLPEEYYTYDGSTTVVKSEDLANPFQDEDLAPLPEDYGSTTVELPPKRREEKRREKNLKEENSEDSPKTYAEFVKMTEKEHGKLVAQFGESGTRACIEKLDNAKGSKGYKYKSDYRAILSWVVGELKLDKKTPGSGQVKKCSKCDHVITGPTCIYCEAAEAEKAEAEVTF